MVHDGRESDGSASRERLKLIPRVFNVEEWAKTAPLSGTVRTQQLPRQAIGNANMLDMYSSGLPGWDQPSQSLADVSCMPCGHVMCHHVQS
jgi:hypothetical protein